MSLQGRAMVDMCISSHGWSYSKEYDGNTKHPDVAACYIDQKMEGISWYTLMTGNTTGDPTGES